MNTDPLSAIMVLKKQALFGQTFASMICGISLGMNLLLSSPISISLILGWIKGLSAGLASLKETGKRLARKSIAREKSKRPACQDGLYTQYPEENCPASKTGKLSPIKCHRVPVSEQEDAITSWGVHK